MLIHVSYLGLSAATCWYPHLLLLTAPPVPARLCPNVRTGFLNRNTMYRFTGADTCSAQAHWDWEIQCSGLIGQTSPTKNFVNKPLHHLIYPAQAMLAFSWQAEGARLSLFLFQPIVMRSAAGRGPFAQAGFVSVIRWCHHAWRAIYHKGAMAAIVVTEKDPPQTNMKLFKPMTKVHHTHKSRNKSIRTIREQKRHVRHFAS